MGIFVRAAPELIIEESGPAGPPNYTPGVACRTDRNRIGASFIYHALRVITSCPLVSRLDTRGGPCRGSPGFHFREARARARSVREKRDFASAPRTFQRRDRGLAQESPQVCGRRSRGRRATLHECLDSPEGRVREFPAMGRPPGLHNQL